MELSIDQLWVTGEDWEDFHAASPAEVLAAAATLDGAEKVRWCALAAEYENDDRELERCTRAHLFVGCEWRLVIPLPDKETTDG